jgi:F0F1-type ATP synthase assembly protein I
MDKGKLSTGANLLRVSTLGINFVLCIFAGFGLGWLAQKYLHLGGWAVIAGFLFGVLASYITLFQDLKRLNKEGGTPPAKKSP